MYFLWVLCFWIRILFSFNRNNKEDCWYLFSHGIKHKIKHSCKIFVPVAKWFISSISNLYQGASLTQLFHIPDYICSANMGNTSLSFKFGHGYINSCVKLVMVSRCSELTWCRKGATFLNLITRKFGDLHRKTLGVPCPAIAKQYSANTS